MNIEPVLILGLAVVFATTIKGTTGFGGTVIALAIGAHVYPVEKLVMVLVMIAWVQSVYLVTVGFRKIQWRIFLTRILPICGLGMPIGAYMFYRLGSSEMKTVLGIFVVVVSIAELYRLYRLKESSKPLPAPVGIAVLLIGGVAHGLFASGGPLIVYYSSREILEKGAFRATLATLWLTLNSTLIVTHAISGSIDISSLKFAAPMLAALAVGIVLGEYLHSKVEEFAFRKMVQFVLLMTGIFLII